MKKKYILLLFFYSLYPLSFPSNASTIKQSLTGTTVHKAHNENTSPTSSLKKGLVGYWSLDGNDISGTTAIDRSSSAENGTITGAVPTLGRIGQALDFQDTDVVTVTTFGGISGSSGATISYWAIQETVTTNDYTLWADTNALIQHGDSFNIVGASNLRIRWYLAGAFRNSHTAVGILDTDWHHYVFRFDAGATEIFQDGISVYQGSDAETTVNVSSPNYTWGIRGGSGGLDGKMDDIRVYDRALSDHEIRRLYNLGAGSKVASTPSNLLKKDINRGLVGYWTFNGSDISGTTVVDHGSGGNNGTLTNNPGFAIGKNGQAVELNGGSTHVLVSADYEPSALSISAWFNTDSVAVWQCLVESTNPGTGWHFYVSNGDHLYSNLGGEALHSTGGTVIPGNWHHGVVTWDGTNVYHYTDGVLTGSDTFGALTTTGATTAIGTRVNGGPTFTFDGKIDEVRIYDRAISAKEARRLYEAGR